MSLRFGILVFPNVQQLDLTGPYEVMATVKGAEVELIWKDRDPVMSSTRLSLTPTATFEDCPPLDVLCIPGGGGVNALLEDKAVLDFIWERAAQARYITSVCSGALVLGAAGLLSGKRATTHWYAHDFLEEFGAIPVDARIVEDGKLITAGGVTSGIDFGLALVARLLGQAEAEIVQLSLE
ncbi:MAG: DJ-1/PfpI family protein, partial [Mesorhizobium sp.]